MKRGTAMTFTSDTGSVGHPTGAWRPSGPLRMTPARWVVLALAVPGKLLVQLPGARA